MKTNQPQQLEKITGYIIDLGFDIESARLFTTLVAQGPLTILQASRQTDIERTKLYRLAEQLVQKGLVEEVIDQKRKLIKAVTTASFDRIVQNHINKTAEIKNTLPEIKELIAAAENKPQSTRVIYYRGVNGITQMIWNELKAYTDILGYINEPFNKIMGQKELEKWGQQFVEKGICLRELRAHKFLTWFKKNSLKHVNLGSNYHWRNAPKQLKEFHHNMDIYNDTLAIFYWYQNEIFGVEIRNKYIAEMQKMLFEMMWSLAEKSKK